MPALINIKSDLTKLRAQPKPFNTQVYSYSSNLVELKTNLTELKFGNDQPGYGSSGLPYIQTRIPTSDPNSPGIAPIYRPGSPGQSDYPIRGGSIDFQIGQQTYTLSSVIDKTRIRKFFEDKQRGTLFIQKQIGLQLTNPKIETGNTLFGLGQGAPVPGLLENTRVYNRGVNTLAQVEVSGTGAHAVRHGTVPFNAFQKNYFAIVNAQNVNNEKITNRLLNLNGLKMTSSTSPFVNPQNVVDINTVNTLGISLNRNLLFQYLGGPGSTYGIGATTIKRAVDTTALGTKIKQFASKNAMVYDQIRAQKSQLGNPNPELRDFRRSLPGQPNWIKQESVDYRFLINKQDKINKLYPFVFDNSIAPWEIDRENTDDLIKFVFEAISNDNTSFSTAIFFRAFLTSGITDNNSAQWNSFKYLGRGENFYTYQGFERSISFSFKVAAQSKEELRPIYNRLNTLVSQVYPDYSEKTQIMRAPIIRLTIGDYLYRMPGFLESVNISVDNDSSWEINLEDDKSGEIAQLPQVINVSISFKPILNELPRRNSFTADLLSVSGKANLGSTEDTVLETYQVNTNTPQLIANNNKIISTFEGTQNSLSKLASPSQIKAEEDAILKGVDVSNIQNEESDPYELERLYAEQNSPTVNDLTGTTTAF